MHVLAPFLVTVCLKALNFLVQILNLIESHGCLGFIDGSIVQPSPTIVVWTVNSVDQVLQNLEFQDWMKTD